MTLPILPKISYQCRGEEPALCEKIYSEAMAKASNCITA
jgi:hypothetical protein